MKTLGMAASFAAFLCCGMLAIDGFLGQLSQLMAGAGYAMLAVVCAVVFARMVLAKDAEEEKKRHR